MKVIKIVVSIVILLILGFIATYLSQDKSKKLEDRKYKEIEELIIDTNAVDVNFYKSSDEYLRVVIYGFSTDTVDLVEGSHDLSIKVHKKEHRCMLNCKQEISIYVPNTLDKLEVSSIMGNIDLGEQNVKNLVINDETGNVNVNHVNFANIKTNTGDIIIKEIEATDNSKITTNTGNINIDKIIGLKVEAESDSGNVKVPTIENEEEFTLNVKTSLGNINIKEYENKSE